MRWCLQRKNIESCSYRENDNCNLEDTDTCVFLIVREYEDTETCSCCNQKTFAYGRCIHCDKFYCYFCEGGNGYCVICKSRLFHGAWRCDCDRLNFFDVCERCKQGFKNLLDESKNKDI